MFVNVRKALKRRSGFSLLEMLAVAVVIGVLALIAVPAVLNAGKASEDAACDASRDQIINAFSTYKARTGNDVTNADVGAVTNYLVNTGYLGNDGAMPTDPSSGSAYTVSVTSVNDASNSSYGVAYSITVECPNTGSDPDHGSDTALL